MRLSDYGVTFSNILWCLNFIRSMVKLEGCRIIDVQDYTGFSGNKFSTYTLLICTDFITVTLHPSVQVWHTHTSRHYLWRRFSMENGQLPATHTRSVYRCCCVSP